MTRLDCSALHQVSTHGASPPDKDKRRALSTSNNKCAMDDNSNDGSFGFGFDFGCNDNNDFDGVYNGEGPFRLEEFSGKTGTSGPRRPNAGATLPASAQIAQANASTAMANATSSAAVADTSGPDLGRDGPTPVLPCPRLHRLLKQMH